MLLNQLFSNKKTITEGGNLSSQSPGWQGMPGEHEAQEIDLKIHDRDFMVDQIRALLQSQNESFAQVYGRPIWDPKLLDGNKMFSGSTLHFFDVKGISTQDFLNKLKKTKVGDIDTQVDQDIGDEITAWLKSVIGKKVGNGTFVGFNSSLSALWLLDDPPVRIQVDYELGPYQAGKGKEPAQPTEWFAYSHSSDLADLQQGIKGVFHKYINRALTQAQTSTKYVARVLKKSVKISDEPVTDSDYSFAVTSSQGGGLAAKYKPYIDPQTGQPMEIDGIPVMQQLDSKDRDYIQNLDLQFQQTYGRKRTASDKKLQNSFVGTIQLMNDSFSPEQNEAVARGFFKILFDPGEQMISKDDPARDRDIKFAAVDSMLLGNKDYGTQPLNVPDARSLRQEAIDMAMAYEQDFKDVEAYKKANPQSKQPRAELMRLRAAQTAQQPVAENFADGRNPQDREQGMQWERQLQRSWAPQAAAYMAKVVKQSFNSLYPDVPIRVKREDIFIMATTDPKARITDLDIDVFNQRNNPNWECNFIVSPLFHMADKTPYLELMVESAASGQYKGVWKLIAQGWARYANSQLQKTGAMAAVFSVDEDHSDAWASIAGQAGLKYIVHNRGFKEDIEENFADGKNPGRKGLAKRSGVNTKASISSLRKTAKNSSGEKARMAHWLANMKSGKAKNKESLSEAEVKAQLRKGMPHLRDLKPADFLDLLDEIHDGNGNFKLQDIPLNVKVDGFGGRFGKNSDGQPFMATSRTEPRYQAGFLDYHKQKGTTDPDTLRRAGLFDDLFNEMMAAIAMVDESLGPDFLVNKQVTCEVLFAPFATETPEGKLKFVGIEYDRLPQGVELVLVPYRIVDATTGEDIPETEDELKAITGLGNQGQVMFMSNRLVQKDGLDVTAIIPPLENLEELKSIVSDTAGKRDRASLTLRKEVEEKLKPIQIALEKAIDEDPNIIGKDMLGQEYEGIVINSRLGPIKVTSQRQKDIIAAKNAARAAARAEQPRENQNKTAVVAIGSFVGHRGHEQLWNLTVDKAAELGGDPYLFIGTAEGKDDPIPPNVKVQTWHKLYPEYANNISTVTQEGGSLLQKIKHELINPLPGKPPRYDNIVIAVGQDRANMAQQMSAALMKAVNKFSGYEHVKVTPYITARSADSGGTGVSFTNLRNTLSDKNLSPEQQLDVWSQGFDVGRLGTDWLLHLMDLTRRGMGIQKMPQQNKPVAERLLNALIKPNISEDIIFEDWQKVNKRDKTDGMSRKAVKAYRRENPGSKLKTAVTTKPGKLKKGGKAAKRRKSFCARMSGMKRAHASAKTKRDPDSPINKALRRWNCESIEEMQALINYAKQVIAEEEQLAEKMAPRSHFAGNWKLGTAAQLKGSMKRPAQQGDLVGEEGMEESSLDPSGLIAAAAMVRDYIITAEVDGKTKKFRIRGMTGPKAAKERFLKHHSMAKVLDVKPEQGVEEGLSKQARAKKEAESVMLAIARLEQELKDPNPHINKDDIRRRLETEKRRLELYRDVLDEQGVAEGRLHEFDYNKHVKMLNAYMKKLGYSYIGHGTDAHVFAKEQGTVIKVLIPRDGDISTAKNPFLAFLSYCEKNAGNPHLPKFIETTKEPIQLGSEKFEQVVMERLQEVDPEYEDMLVSMIDNIEEGKPLDPQYNPYAKFYQTLKAVMLTGKKLGFENDILTFQSVNIMQRGNTLVITDPWVAGYGQQGVAEEKQKGVDGKACWKGYKRMGTKKKGGRTVDNCVPINEDLEQTMQKYIDLLIKNNR